MNKQKNRPKRGWNEPGFSLMELIIAIAVLVILTGLLAPQFMKYIERSRRAVCMSGMDVIGNEFTIGMLEIDRTADAEAAIRVLDEVMESHGGERDTKTDSIVHVYQGICKSGGVYRCEFDKSLDYISMECSKHGEWELDVRTLSSLLNSLSFEKYEKLHAKYPNIKAYFANGHVSLDSEAEGTDNSSDKDKIYAPYSSLAGVVSAELNKLGINVSNKSWRMYCSGDKFYLYLTDRKIENQDITDKNQVTCTKYDINNKTVSHGSAPVKKAQPGNYPVIDAENFIIEKN